MTGPTAVPPPAGVQVVPVLSAQEMLRAVEKAMPECQMFIAVAAVADYTPLSPQEQKMKKDARILTLELAPTADILANVANRADPPFCIGFAAESEIDIDGSRAKLARKGVDYLFVNDVSNQEVFNADSNGGILLGKDGLETPFDYQRKDTLSHALLDVLVKTLG